MNDAYRLQVNERQRKSLQGEIALYSDLKTLVDSGVAPPATTPFPVDPHNVEKIPRRTRPLDQSCDQRSR